MKVSEIISCIIPIVLILAYIALGIACFTLGMKMGQDMNTHEYRLFLEEEDVEIILETLDEVVSRQITR